ncbi:MAG TPA: ABC transporter permease [Bryobacteraceae bacterium]|nr:ABC transporter permease [Bryobacteraceae bacterium]
MSNPVRTLLDALFRRRRLERDMEEELGFHLEQRISGLIRSGHAREEAERQARIEFGAAQAYREECREARGFRLFDEAAQDVRYTLRSLRAHPAFAAVAILSMALGIGANTAIFSLLNGVALKSLPVAAPGELYNFAFSDPHQPRRFSWPSFVRLQAAGTPMTAVTRTFGMNANMDGTPGAEHMRGQLVSGEHFAILGLQPALGRLFTPDDNRTVGGHPVAVVSYGFWQRRFAGSPDVLGRGLTLNGAHFTIIGVGPRAFSGVWADAPTDVWLPVMMQSAVQYAGNRSSHNGDDDKPWPPQEQILWLDIIARIPADHAAATRAHLNVAFAQELQHIGALYGDDTDRRQAVLAQHLVLEPAGRGFSYLRTRYSKPLVVLMGLVGLVLLIACANVANLLLARASSRQREIAVRLSIGAGRGRLIRQFLTESLVLAVLGALFGLLLARGATAFLVHQVLGSSTAASAAATMDLRVAVFTLTITLLTGVLFGLLPALRGTRVDLSNAMKAGGRATQGGARSGGMKLLVASQVALSLVLLVTSGLFARSFRHLLDLDPGFDRASVLNIQVRPRSDGFTEQQLPDLYRRIVERVEAVPGVRSAAVASDGVVSGSIGTSAVEIAGYQKRPGETIAFQTDKVGLGYFHTIGMRLVEGRDFTWRDDAHAPKVAIVNQTLARRYFPGRSAIGQRFGDDKPDVEIVGVVADARVNDVREAAPVMCWYPIAQNMDYIDGIYVHVSGNPDAIAPALRKAVASAAPTLTVGGIATLDRLIRDDLSRERLIVQLSTAFGALALLLAAVGLYGVMSYAVARRTSEFGVRVALGAARRQVQWMMIRESARVIALGLACGIPLLMAASTIVNSMLFGVTAADPLAIAVATALLIVVALLAALIPATRASHVDPVVALRYE